MSACIPLWWAYMYVKLVEALCAEHQTNLIKVDDNKKPGECVGLCKTDREGKPRKVVCCTCVVVKDYGKESQAKDVIKEYFKCKKWWNKKLGSCFVLFFKKNLYIHFSFKKLYIASNIFSLFNC